MKGSNLFECLKCGAIHTVVAVNGPQDLQPPTSNVIGGGNTRIVDVGAGGTGPYTGTGRDTTITPVASGDVVSLPAMTSKNFELAVGGVVAFKIDIPAGQFADMGFRAGIGEYGTPRAEWDLALSRTPFEIEGAPARSPNNIAGVTIENDSAQLFSPGEWYLNVRVNKAEGPTSGFTLSWYGPHDPV